MADTKNKSMIDYNATIFVENRVFTRMFSEIVKNQNEQDFFETIGLPEDFYLPFFSEDENGSVVYRIKVDPLSNMKVTVNGDHNLVKDHEISTGDYITIHARDRIIRVLVVRTTQVSIGYKKYKVENSTNLFIGRTPANDISCNLTDFLSRDKHAVIRVDKDGTACIEDIKRTVGVYVNGVKAISKQLAVFDEIYIMGLSIVYMGSFIAVNSFGACNSLIEIDGIEAKEPISNKDKENYFVSTPRILKPLIQEEIEVDAPPAPPSMDKTPAILLIGPSLTMSMVMLASLSVSIFSAISGGNMATVIASGTMAVGMLLGSLMWPSLLRSYQKKTIQAEEKLRKNKYSAYISDIEKKLIAKADRSSRILNESLNPSPDVLCSFLDDDNSRLKLWERSAEDSDFLDLRIGTGVRTFDVVTIKIPRKGFQLHDDELRDLPDALSEKYGTIANVPLTLDLRNNHTIGLIGKREYIWTIINELVLNIIALHSYDEVKLVFVVPPKEQIQVEAYKNVPHAWSDDKKIRYFATNSDEVHYMFNTIDETLIRRENSDDGEHKSIPHYCLFVTDPRLVEKEALGRYIEDADNSVGLTTIFAYGDITKLPRTCKAIVQCDENRTGYYIKNKNSNRFIPFKIDRFDSNLAKRFAVKLSQLPIKRNQKALGIADRISFLQMYKVGNVSQLEIEKHWDSNNSAKTLAAPIGVMAGGEVFRLDIHEAYHGCHGLVAGTTGSGKSEFLQALVLSLAINYSPNEVAFVLVDFKGGDMARPFIEKPHSPALPHLSATISNLSGNILYRALVSLEAEIKFRQKVFNESAADLGVDKLDINSYHKYYKGGRLSRPLPHLVIIIDEFAQLKTQQPEFLAQLINVAQVGRSLGIHLILATQKPSGIVDPQIMSNSRFKVCLKVAEKQDSIDMINKPDSALIKNPGRLYLQVGYNEIYECIQSGYSGADYIPTDEFVSDEDVTVQMTDNTANPIHSARIDFSSNKTDKTELEAVVSEIIEIGKKRGIKTRPLWLDVLPNIVSLDSLKNKRKGICTATIGLVDYVKTQEQTPLYIDFEKTGHIALYGASGTGKTTFLQTLIYSMVCSYCYSPEELNVYAMDFGGRNLGYLNNLPHVGGVVFADEDQKLVNLIETLRSIVEERKRLFSQNNCGTFVDYRKSSKELLPAIIVLIDNYASFRDKNMDIADELTEIISAGKTFGVYFVITGNTRNSIYYRVTEHISTFFTLRMNDPNNYLDILNVRPPVIPDDINGRGITVIDRNVVEYQIALALIKDTEAERISAISTHYEMIKNGWSGYLPIRIDISESGSEDVISGTDKYVDSGLMKNESPESLVGDRDNYILAKSKSGALTYGISLTDENTVCICAKDISDLDEYYVAMLNRGDSYTDRIIVFIDDDNRQFEGLAEGIHNCRYISGTTELDSFINDLKPELNSRLESQSARERQMIIIVGEFNAFFDMITDEQASFWRKVFQYINSPKYRIAFICGFVVSGEKNNDRLYMSMIVNARNYILCEGSYETAASKIETLPTIYNVKAANCYICLNDKVTEIRW